MLQVARKVRETLQWGRSRRTFQHSV